MVVRLANVYGPRANIRSSAFGFINYFIGLALRNEDVTVYGEGAQLRTVTFVDDAVHALLLAAVSDHAAGQVLFAVAERQYTVRELADTIVRQMGAGRVRSMPWPKDRLAIEIGDANISSARIKSTLGWEAKTGLEDGMARTRDYYRPLLDRYMS
jgi:UDP-glucose 4-epimerase